MDAALSPDTLARLAADAGLEVPSLVVRALEDGPSAQLEPERALYPASMIKTPLVAAAMLDVAAGRLRLSQRVRVDQANMTYNDAPSPLVPGYQARLDELCELAISRSDNVATNMLFDVVGRQRATELAATTLGLPHTVFGRKLSGSDPLIDDPGWDGSTRNAHPAGDAAALFRAVALDAVPGSDLIRAALSRQFWNDKLSRGIRPGDRLAHKTGDTDDVTHDGGILTTEAGRTYVVVVYTGRPSTDTNNARFAPFMRSLRALL
jgi:beta-lactamase class A